MFLKAGVGAAVAASVALAIDATFIEPQHPLLKRIDVWLPRLPQELNGFTIAQLSDFHYDRYFSATPIAAAVNITNGLNPDLVALTGDYVTVPLLADENQRLPKAARHAKSCAHLLGGLRARLGTVAVLGNHDEFSDPDEVTGALQYAGIRVLRNQSVLVERGGARLWVAGLNDVMGGGANVGEALRGVPSGDTTVLLCHEPDYADQVAAYAVDLQLSGHSHGGQVRFPVVGALYLPRLGRKYPWGLRRLGQMMLYTNCGIGTIRVPVRWHCPPEVTLLTLRSGTEG